MLLVYERAERVRWNELCSNFVWGDIQESPQTGYQAKELMALSIGEYSLGVSSVPFLDLVGS